MSHFFTVTPRVSLQIVNTAEKSLIRAGDTVYIRCLTKANPLVHTISWYFQVKVIFLTVLPLPVPEAGFEHLTTMGNFKIATIRKVCFQVKSKFITGH